MRTESNGKLWPMFLLLCCSTCLAQNKPIDSDARREIDAGNQQWVDAMKQGDAAMLEPGNTERSVDCGPEGDCIRGRSALREHMKKEMAKLGKADSASVVSMGSVQQGRYVYEWGEAKAHFPNVKNIVDRYLTVWQKQPDGRWKIFRNLVIPNKRSSLLPARISLATRLLNEPVIAEYQWPTSPERRLCQWRS